MQKTETLRLTEEVNDELPTITATENQRKVIKDKYLRDAPSLEYWLKGVALNIALGELFYLDIPEEKLFKGVKYERVEYDTRGDKPTIIHHLHAGHKTMDEQKKNFRQFMKNLYDLAETNPTAKKAVQTAFKKFYKMMAQWKFLPNSPTLMNAGRDLQQLSACYVLPVDDSIEGIYKSVMDMALIHQSGGGTGFDFSRLRPSGSMVQSTKGVSSGPCTFMQLFDKSTDVVKQGGTRRGANMGILRYDHPDIDTFIEMKQGVMENFNVSVTIDKEFMEKVANAEDYNLLNPKNGEVMGTKNAKEMWDRLVQGAWETGDPGIIFIDRINESRSNPVPAQGMIESTNPCGEQPLLPYEPCNLGSINLSKFVNAQGTDMDWPALKEMVHTATQFLDNVVTVNNYPIPEIEVIAKKNRRVGLGVMGWAETCVKLGLSYNNEAAFKKAEELMTFINDEAMEASENLAKKRGAFGGFKNSIFDKQGTHFRGEDHRPRNSARTTIAPTGTIGIASGLQGAGIEPFFAIVYTRYNARALDALKRGETPDESDTFWEVNPLFEKIAAENDYFGFTKEELWQKVDENHKSAMGIKEIPEKIQNMFLTSHDLSPLDHVRMQCAFQAGTDNAVSKTVNLKNNATAEDVEEVYMLAYKLGAKGVTIYRDGSKDFQVLNLKSKGDSEETQEVAAEEPAEQRVNRKQLAEYSDYYAIETGSGTLHIHINYDELGPRRIFGNLAPLGTEISGLTSALCIMISKYLEQGGDPIRILKHLNSIKSDRPFGFGQKRVDSIPHAISKALRGNLVKTGFFRGEDGQTSLAEPSQVPSGIQHAAEKTVKSAQVDERLYCSQCYSTNVQMMAGCSEPTCFDCGYSKCS